MDQRAPRLGDIVDDYCPRERRITNHAIVAIVEDAIRQTRCTTCDAEHGFKQGREPRKRKEPESAFDQVLASVTPVERVVNRAPDVVAPAAPVARAATVEAPVHVVAPQPEADEPPHDQAWSAHRRLIRAALPKTETDVPTPRPIPEFTMHQRPSGRGGRGGRPGPDGEVNGNVAGYNPGPGGNGRDDRSGRMFHGNGHSQGQGQGGGRGRSFGGGRGDGQGPASGGGPDGGRARHGRRRGHNPRGH